MEFKNIKVGNFEGAFRGMRNPLDSWAKADSKFGIGNIDALEDAEQDVVDGWIAHESELTGKKYVDYSEDYENIYQKYADWIEEEGILTCKPSIVIDYDCFEYAFIGPKDMRLAQRLIKSGPEHCKFLRQIQVCVDITAPLYWWKEFDTYKVGTTANSTSTMHTLCKTPITSDKFEWDKGFADYQDTIMDMCEDLRKKFIETQDKTYWRALVQILPEAFLQTRTVTLSYANLRNIYFQRRNHKLTEWSTDFIEFIKSLPYTNELIILEDTNENLKTN